ncbi:MAG: redoxin domain-containing protein [Thermoanaerobaculia bacterium]|nr:redoxin domain-containing protein [Thermoanaerobaculia bacterium]
MNNQGIFRIRPRRLGKLVLCLLAVGATLPLLAQGGWRLRGLEGGSLAPADLTSGNTVIVVWAGWSPRSRDIREKVASLKSEVGNARLLTVNFQEEESAVREFLGGKSFPAPIYLDTDGAFARQHQVTNLPGLVIYRQGEVVYQGKYPSDPAGLVRTKLQ